MLLFCVLLAKKKKTKIFFIKIFQIKFFSKYSSKFSVSNQILYSGFFHFFLNLNFLCHTCFFVFVFILIFFILIFFFLFISVKNTCFSFLIPLFLGYFFYRKKTLVFVCCYYCCWYLRLLLFNFSLFLLLSLDFFTISRTTSIEKLYSN